MPTKSIFEALQAGIPLDAISHRILSGSEYSPALQQPAALAPPAPADPGAVLPPPSSDNRDMRGVATDFYKALQKKPEKF